jgi:beta-glucanase (GH16 family)
MRQTLRVSLLLVGLALAGCELAPPVTTAGSGSVSMWPATPGELICAGPDDNRPAEAFVQEFDGADPIRWCASDGGANAAPFQSGWRADHVKVADGALTLRLDDAGVAGRPYASGEYLTMQRYGHGRFEARLKPIKAAGVVTAVFTYAGPDSGSPHDEIDMEFLGNKPTKMQANYFTDDVGGHETLIELGFDATADYHDYAFEWRPGSIRWFVDGRMVHEETGTRGPLPRTPGRILANAWAAVGADGWVGPFNFPGGALEARIDRVSYRPL